MDRTDQSSPLITGSAQAREMDLLASGKYGIETSLLMEDAAFAALILLRDMGLTEQGTRFVLFCGSGNNGGDGLALGALLRSRGHDVLAVLAGQIDSKSLCAFQRDRFVNAGGQVISGEQFVRDQGRFSLPDSVVVDALLGTGLSRKPEGLMADLIRWINDHGGAMLSLDVPSGLDADTGFIQGLSVRAAATLSFGSLKKGLLLREGLTHAGAVSVSPLSFPPALLETVSASRVNGLCSLVKRPADGHKGTFGKVLSITGSVQYQGAPGFVSAAVLKGGAGVSVVACPQAVIAQVSRMIPETVFLPLPEEGGVLAPGGVTQIEDSLSGVRGVIFGPGLSLGQGPDEYLRFVWNKADVPLLVDGDGLTLLSRQAEPLPVRRAPTLLTPHPGEMARLIGCSSSEVEEDREKTLSTAVQKFKATVVLKGHRTLIGFPDGRIFWNLTGNSGMATAGSGDLLSGLIMGLYASGNEWVTAVRAGVFIHGLAGDQAAAVFGQQGLIASNILDFLPQAISAYQTGTYKPSFRSI